MTQSDGTTLNKRQIGKAHEEEAARYLQSKHYRIREMNYRCRQGEIDIIAEDGRYLVFVEVKYRRSASSGTPLEAVGTAKQRQISRVALFYLSYHRMDENRPIRFDVIGITPEGLTHIENAFDFRLRR